MEGTSNTNLLALPKVEELKDGELNAGKNSGMKPRMRRSAAVNFDDGESNVDVQKIVDNIKPERNDDVSDSD